MSFVSLSKTWEKLVDNLRPEACIKAKIDTEGV